MCVGQVPSFDRKIKVLGRFWALNGCRAGFELS